MKRKEYDQRLSTKSGQSVSDQQEEAEHCDLVPDDGIQEAASGKITEFKCGKSRRDVEFSLRRGSGAWTS